MQTINVEDVRNDFAPVEHWLGQGESVELRRGGREFARIVPTALPPTEEGEARPVPKVDWEAQAKEIWGDRVFTAEEVRRMREDELEGEEG